jgi:hypothetical protein
MDGISGKRYVVVQAGGIYPLFIVLFSRAGKHISR